MLISFDRLQCGICKSNFVYLFASKSLQQVIDRFQKSADIDAARAQGGSTSLITILLIKLHIVVMPFRSLYFVLICFASIYLTLSCFIFTLLQFTLLYSPLSSPITTIIVTIIVIINYYHHHSTCLTSYIDQAWKRKRTRYSY